MSQLIKIILPALILTGFGGCLGGCQQSNADWKADNISIEPGIECRFGTVVYLGVPGHISGSAKGKLDKNPVGGAKAATEAANQPVSDTTGEPTPNP